MAKNTIAAPVTKGKEGFRNELTNHEIALIAELFDELREGSMTVKEIAACFV